MTKKKPCVVYIGRNNNSHDQKFIDALSRHFRVVEIFTQNLTTTTISNENFAEASLIVAGPLTDTISAIPLSVRLPVLGISHAYDLNIEFNHPDLKANIFRCTAIMSDCTHITSILRNTYSYTNKIYEIPWGCEQDYFSKVKVLFDQKPKILVTRNWLPLYRNDVIINSLKLLELKGIDFSCTFIGDGPLLEDQIENLDKRLELLDIRFLGHQSHVEIRNEMSDNWIYISAASSDGTSISLLEAMSAGMICIATDFPSNLEWIEHSKSGFIFPNGDSEALASMIEQVSTLSLQEKIRISKSAREITLKRGDWRKNQIAFTSVAIAMT